MRPVYSHLTAIYKANRRHSSRFCRTFPEAKVIVLNFMDDRAGNQMARSVVLLHATPSEPLRFVSARHPSLPSARPVTRSRASAAAACAACVTAVTLRTSASRTLTATLAGALAAAVGRPSACAIAATHGG